MLLCCAECGRIKGNKFPLKNGEPLLIDPTFEEPWEYLDYDPKTGNIMERYILNRNEVSERGKITVDVLKLKERDALANGHRTTFRRLKEQVEAFLADSAMDANIFVGKLKADDKHNLLGWCLYGNGGNEEPFKTLRREHPHAWEALEEAVRNA
jgi:hypothetical protein